MSCIDNYKKRVSLRGSVDSRVRVIYEARKNFERSLKKDPSSRTLKITDVGEVNISESTKLVQCIVNDFSKNDQKTFDEKVLYVRYDENVGLGSYVEYDGYIWLVIFREHRAADVYKSFIMRKCNQFINYEYQNEIYSIPCVIKNLTQYSDGLQDIVYTSIERLYESIGDVVIINPQDLLLQGGNHRFNAPGTMVNNWMYNAPRSLYNENISDFLSNLVIKTRR